MIRRFLCAALVAALSVPAQSIAATATFFVDPVSGQDTNNGRFVDQAWRTLQYVNATLLPLAAPNDSDIVVNLMPGQYPHSPNPANPQTGGKRFYFYGSMTRPDVVLFLNGITCESSYTSIRGATVNGTISTNTRADGSGGRSDSLADLVVVTGPIVLDGWTYSTMARVRGNAPMVRIGNGGPSHRSVGVNLSYCRFNIQMPQFPNNSEFGFCSGRTTSGDFVNRWRVDSMVVERDTFDIATYPTSGFYDYAPRKHFHTRYSTFKYNIFRVTNKASGTGESWPGLTLRDSSIGNIFNGETMIGGGPGQVTYMFSNDGSNPNTVKGTIIDSCYISTWKGTAAFFQNGMNNVNITRSVFASGDGYALTASSLSGSAAVIGPSTIDHNTFASNQGNYSPVTFHEGGSLWTTDSTRFTNNIVYSFRPQESVPDWALFPNDPKRTLGGFSQHASSDFDLWLVSNWNLFAFYGYTYTPGDHAISYCCWKTARPEGNNGEGLRDYYATTSRIRGDSLSYYMTPMFKDSTFKFNGTIRTPFHVASYGTASPDSLFGPRLMLGSGAIAKGKSGSDIGAWDYAAGAAIEINPNTVYFPSGYVGQQRLAQVTIRNYGGATLTLGAPASGSAEATGSFISSSVAAGDTTSLKINHTVVGDQGSSFSITFTTNDPLFPTATVRVRYQSAGGGGAGPFVTEP